MLRLALCWLHHSTLKWSWMPHSSIQCLSLGVNGPLCLPYCAMDASHQHLLLSRLAPAPVYVSQAYLVGLVGASLPRKYADV